MLKIIFIVAVVLMFSARNVEAEDPPLCPPVFSGTLPAKGIRDCTLYAPHAAILELVKPTNGKVTLIVEGDSLIVANCCEGNRKFEVRITYPN